MSFDSAIPLNRVAYMQQSAPQYRSSDRGMQGDVDRRKNSRQRVNISQDTLIRIARSRLSRVVDQKLAYNSNGALGARGNLVGQMLSAKA